MSAVVIVKIHYCKYTFHIAEETIDIAGSPNGG